MSAPEAHSTFNNWDSDNSFMILVEYLLSVTYFDIYLAFGGRGLSEAQKDSLYKWVNSPGIVQQTTHAKLGVEIAWVHDV